MQLLCEHSEESDTDCLGIIPVQVKRFSAPLFFGEGLGVRFKIPQVGWNTIYDLRSELFKDVEENSYIYNVHSYYVEDSKYTISKCNYELEYAAAIKKDNFYGVQFHTEKSAEVGDRIIKNFLEAPIPWRGVMQAAIILNNYCFAEAKQIRLDEKRIFK